MEFYEAIEKRRTTRQFLKKEANFEAIKRILGRLWNKSQRNTPAFCRSTATYTRAATTAIGNGWTGKCANMQKA